MCEENSIFSIIDSFDIKGIGTVVTGFIYKGQMSIGDTVEFLNEAGLFTGCAIVTDIQQLENKHLRVIKSSEMAGLVVSGIDKNTCLNSKYIIIRSAYEKLAYLSFLLNQN